MKKAVTNKVNIFIPNTTKLFNFNDSEFNENFIGRFSINSELSNKNDDLKKSKQEQEENEKSNIKIIIKNNKFKDIELYVNSNDYIKNIIQKYKTKLQDDRIKDIIFKNDKGKILQPDKKLGDIGITDMSIIYSSYDEPEKGNSELTPEQIEKMKDLIKKKKKQGLITIIIYNPSLGNQFYFIDPNVKFQVVEDNFKNLNGRNWFFLFDGKRVDNEKTLKELKIKMFSKIIASELFNDYA